MSQKNKVLVKINGQEYPIVGAEPKEYLLKVGSFVDDNMEAVARANKRLSTSMIAVLTCINISDQYLKLKRLVEELQQEMERPKEKVAEMEAYIEALHGKLNEKNEECSNLENKIREIETNIEEDEEVTLLRAQLQAKDEDLEKAQALINDLQNKLIDNQIKLVQATKELEDSMSKNNHNKPKRF